VLAAAIDIRRWLETDRQTGFAQRLARDRAIGRTIATTDELGRVLAWWEQVPRGETATAGLAAQGLRVERLRRMATVALCLLGVLLGTATAGVAFAYDGRHPVNLFRLFALLVGVPAVLLLLTLVVVAAGGPRPGRGGLFAALDAGRWAGAALDRLARFELFTPGAGAPLGLAAFARWQVVVFSQWVAVGFFVGALGLAFMLVAFTDLAFGWSTTLEYPAGDVQRLFAVVSAPWAAWLPQAAPDLGLTELSRYFRGEAPALAAERAARLGAWWPFVLMTVAVYGLLPRLLLLGFSGWRLRVATRALLRADPEVTALLDRLAAPLVAPGGDGSGQVPQAPGQDLPAPGRVSGGAPCVLVIWNRAMPAQAARDLLGERLGLRVAALCELSVLESDAQQREALAVLVRAGGDDAAQRAIVLTRGWEPPLLEFGDFLGLVRAIVGASASLTVVPIDVSGSRVDAADRAVWAQALGRLRDPRLYVQDVLP
jgi:hypothetical protein